jgi:hypothetical protein
MCCIDFRPCDRSNAPEMISRWTYGSWQLTGQIGGFAQFFNYEPPAGRPDIPRPLSSGCSSAPLGRHRPTELL